MGRALRNIHQYVLSCTCSFVSLTATSVFNIPCALAKNIGTLLVSRFLCGLFGSGPFALAGGAIADIWDNNERGFAVALFAAAPYG